MRRDVSLTVASLLTIVLLTVHLTHDFVYGLDSMSRAGTYAFLLVVLVAAYGSVELAGRRSGYVVTLLLGVFGGAMPVLHTVGGPQSAARGFLFVWTLLTLGACGVFSAALSARGLWRSVRAPVPPVCADADVRVVEPSPPPPGSTTNLPRMVASPRP